MAGENSGMAILLRSMGVDPKAIMESVQGFGALASQVQLTVTSIEAQLSAILENQANLAKQLAGLQFQLTELALKDETPTPATMNEAGQTSVAVFDDLESPKND